MLGGLVDLYLAGRPRFHAGSFVVSLAPHVYDVTVQSLVALSWLCRGIAALLLCICSVVLGPLLLRRVATSRLTSPGFSVPAVLVHS